ncbi:twin-arginine translocase TatA/TatE family subunit [Nigerium sp.]|uniref:twin-arginine translocase TatA/TatE family subunit n=1 Tax=Nigerium sp. TaxID=2042655 RepID=UPI0032216621
MDFNGPELIILVALAIIIFGPEKLPELARKLARIIAYLRRIGGDARAQLRDELGPEFDNIHLADLNPKTFVSRHLLSADEVSDLREIRDDFAGAREDLRSATASGATAASIARPDDGADGDEPAAADGNGDPEFLRAVAFDPEAT